MLALQSTLDDAMATARHWKFQHGHAIRQYNRLIDRINALGGEEFLTKAKIPQQQAQTSGFSQVELRQLLALVHPDKHKGKVTAVELTKKILQLRK